MFTMSVAPQLCIQTSIRTDHCVKYVCYCRFCLENHRVLFRDVSASEEVDCWSDKVGFCCSNLISETKPARVLLSSSAPAPASPSPGPIMCIVIGRCIVSASRRGGKPLCECVYTAWKCIWRDKNLWAGEESRDGRIRQAERTWFLSFSPFRGPVWL